MGNSSDLLSLSVHDSNRSFLTVILPPYIVASDEISHSNDPAQEQYVTRHLSQLLNTISELRRRLEIKWKELDAYLNLAQPGELSKKAKILHHYMGCWVRKTKQTESELSAHNSIEDLEEMSRALYFYLKRANRLSALFSRVSKENSEPKIKKVCFWLPKEGVLVQPGELEVRIQKRSSRVQRLDSPKEAREAVQCEFKN